MKKHGYLGEVRRNMYVCVSIYKISLRYITLLITSKEWSTFILQNMHFVLANMHHFLMVPSLLLNTQKLRSREFDVVLFFTIKGKVNEKNKRNAREL